MIRFHKNEKWKKFIPFANARLNYAISNFGRLVSYEKKIEDGTLLKGSMIKRFNVFNVKTIVKGKEKHSKLFIHRLVAENFLPNRNKNKTYVLHLNHNL